MDVCRYTNNEDNVERYKHRKKKLFTSHVPTLKLVQTGSLQTEKM